MPGQASQIIDNLADGGNPFAIEVLKSEGKSARPE